MPTAVPVSKILELLNENVVPFHFGTKLAVSDEMVEEPSFPLKVLQSDKLRHPDCAPEAV